MPPFVCGRFPGFFRGIEPVLAEVSPAKGAGRSCPYAPPSAQRRPSPILGRDGGDGGPQHPNTRNVRATPRPALSSRSQRAISSCILRMASSAGL